MPVQPLAISGREDGVMGRRKLVAFLVDIQCCQLLHDDSLTEPHLDVTAEIAEPHEAISVPGSIAHNVGQKGTSKMKVAIITGASVGIGSATAQAFLDAGFKVFNLARRKCPITEVTSLPCDLASEAAIARAADALQKSLEGCSEVALVHNASQMRKDSATDCSSDSLRQVMETNVIAINSLNQRLLPLMSEHSSVLYVGSTLAEKAVSSSFSYVVSKHAQLGMMRATCQDLHGQRHPHRHDLPGLHRHRNAAHPPWERPGD